MALGVVVSSPLHVVGADDVVAEISAGVVGVVSGLAAAGSGAAAVVAGTASVVVVVVGAVLSASALACGALVVSVVAALSVVAAAGVAGLAPSVCSDARSLFIIVVTRTAFCSWNAKRRLFTGNMAILSLLLCIIRVKARRCTSVLQNLALPVQPLRSFLMGLVFNLRTLASGDAVA